MLFNDVSKFTSPNLNSDHRFQGAKVGLKAAASVVAISAITPVVGALVLRGLGYPGVSPSALAKAGAIGACMTTAPAIGYSIGRWAYHDIAYRDHCNSFATLYDEIHELSDSSIPFTTMFGSVWISGVSIERAAAASVVGSGTIFAITASHFIAALCMRKR